MFTVVAATLSMRPGQGQDILANHPRPEPENTGEPPSKKFATEAGMEVSNGGASEEPMRMSHMLHNSKF